MMGANAPLSIAPAAPEVACAVGDGCSYLRTLAAIERIAGFEHTAQRYARAAARCREEGCRAATAKPVTVPDVGSSRFSDASKVIPLKLAMVPEKFGDAASVRGAGAPIAFSREAHFDIVSDHEGNFVERRELKLKSLPTTADPLGYLYRYWADLRASGALQFSNVDTVHFARARVIGSMHVVDVSSGDPDEFRFDVYGYALPLRRPERVRALPVKIYADATMRDYNTVRAMAVPKLHHVRCHLERTSYHYTRLILPFLNTRGSVERLLIAIRQEPGDGFKLQAGN